ncbi:hypothetical protein R3P38DRAFT_3179216 [Favolaschia claudopus]|uniref:Uncharacterized protein n=1 Tax=Favolaschia claudopus TaxID=2862362 RepID=A0AAW0CVQ0_9AGAR
MRHFQVQPVLLFALFALLFTPLVSAVTVVTPASINVDMDSVMEFLRHATGTLTCLIGLESGGSHGGFSAHPTTRAPSSRCASLRDESIDEIRIDP